MTRLTDTKQKSLFRGNGKAWKPTGIVQGGPEPILSSPYGVLFQGDCLDVLPRIKSETIDTVFADPPFNLGKTYGAKVNDNRAEHEYIDWCKRWVVGPKLLADEKGNPMKRVALATIVLAFLLACGCGRKTFTEWNSHANVEKATMGKTKQEVVSILGTPDFIKDDGGHILRGDGHQRGISVVTPDFIKNDDGHWWQYDNTLYNKATEEYEVLSLRFQGGKVIKVDAVAY